MKVNMMNAMTLFETGDSFKRAFMSPDPPPPGGGDDDPPPPRPPEPV